MPPIPPPGPNEAAGAEEGAPGAPHPDFDGCAGAACGEGGPQPELGGPAGADCVGCGAPGEPQPDAGGPDWASLTRVWSDAASTGVAKAASVSAADRLAKSLIDDSPDPSAMRVDP